MTATLAIAVAALLIAAVAYAYARRLARRLTILEEMYWQLKFEHGELKAKLDPSSPGPAPQANFIPLTRLRSGSAAESYRATGSSGEAGSLKQ